MIVIIPLGGLGQRFTDVGYDLPKPLVKVQGKEIIYWILDSLKLKNKKNKKIFIVYNPVLDNYDFETKILHNYPNINLYRLSNSTQGPVETISFLLKSINKENLNEKVLIIDGDTFYKKDIINIASKFKNNVVFYSKNYEIIPRYSYIKIGANKIITDIKEKIKISNNANTGAYFFRKLSELNFFVKTGLKKNKRLFTSQLYKHMISKNIKCYSYQLPINCIKEIGTPESLKKFSISNPQEKKRFCFDLDETLVTLPLISGNYETVEPKHENIKFLNFLKSHGHYIIIYTARRMRTHKGNINKVIKDIKKITIKQLKKFNIRYDELIFGKPYAHYYIDDLAINAYENLQYKLGYYQEDTFVRKFNSVSIGEKFTIKKSENILKLRNEILYYKNLPANKKKYFPILHSYKKNSYKISTIHFNSLSYLYLNQILTKKDLFNILILISKFHEIKNIRKKINIYANYNFKFNFRIKKLNKTILKENHKHINAIRVNLKKYDKNKMGIHSIIHGDMVFTNIFFDLRNRIKFIDPRGSIHNQFSIYGDLFYDYAKIYQSLTGYEHILSGKKDFSIPYFNNLRKFFENYFIEKYGDVQFRYLKYITASLYFLLLEEI